MESTGDIAAEIVRAPPVWVVEEGSDAASLRTERWLLKEQSWRWRRNLANPKNLTESVMAKISMVSGDSIDLQSDNAKISKRF